MNKLFLLVYFCFYGVSLIASSSQAPLSLKSKELYAACKNDEKCVGWGCDLCQEMKAKVVRLRQGIPFATSLMQKSFEEKILDAFDTLIAENKVDRMKEILADPTKFTAQYKLSSMTAQQLVNMKRENTGNMSLHVAAEFGYKDLRIAQLLLLHGASAHVKNKQGWKPLSYPHNINFFKFLLEFDQNDSYSIEELQCFLHDAHNYKFYILGDHLKRYNNSWQALYENSYQLMQEFGIIDNEFSDIARRVIEYQSKINMLDRKIADKLKEQLSNRCFQQTALAPTPEDIIEKDSLTIADYVNNAQYIKTITLSQRAKGKKKADYDLLHNKETKKFPASILLKNILALHTTAMKKSTIKEYAAQVLAIKGLSSIESEASPKQVAMHNFDTTQGITATINSSRRK